MGYKLHLGDALDVLKLMPDNSIDAICTDPPAGINFMNVAFDSDRGGRDQWIAWLKSIMQEARRVIKPGGHAFVWALPRTSHWTATAIEDAGWEIRDICTHIFASGFPKSLDVGKAIDKMAGAEREVVGVKSYPREGTTPVTRKATRIMSSARDETVGQETNLLTAPATDAARQWDGWGTALKPAAEHWILARKPLSEPTVAANVLRWGCGALNIDRSRIGTTEYTQEQWTQKGASRPTGTVYGTHRPSDTPLPAGRWPANVLLSHVSPDADGNGGCVEVGTRRVKGNPQGVKPANSRQRASGYALTPGTTDYAAADGTETVSAWECVEGCPVAELDRQSGIGKSKATFRGVGLTGSDVYGSGRLDYDTLRGHNDTGGASRFFFVAKPSRAERERGLSNRTPERVNDGRDTPIDNPYQRGETQRQNTHPTVKATALMRHLLTLVVPPGGICLDPFMGSGSTGVAAAELGLDFIGIEQSPDYYEIARLRIEDAELRMEAERVLPLFSYGGIEL